MNSKMKDGVSTIKSTKLTEVTGNLKKDIQTATQSLQETSLGSNLNVTSGGNVESNQAVQETTVNAQKIFQGISLKSASDESPNITLKKQIDQGTTGNNLNVSLGIAAKFQMETTKMIPINYKGAVGIKATDELTPTEGARQIISKDQSQTIGSSSNIEGTMCVKISNLQETIENNTTILEKSLTSENSGIMQTLNEAATVQIGPGNDVPTFGSLSMSQGTTVGTSGVIPRNEIGTNSENSGIIQVLTDAVPGHNISENQIKTLDCRSIIKETAVGMSGVVPGDLQGAISNNPIIMQRSENSEILQTLNETGASQIIPRNDVQRIGSPSIMQRNVDGTFDVIPPSLQGTIVHNQTTMQQTVNSENSRITQTLNEHGAFQIIPRNDVPAIDSQSIIQGAAFETSGVLQGNLQGAIGNIPTILQQCHTSENSGVITPPKEAGSPGVKIQQLTQGAGIVEVFSKDVAQPVTPMGTTTAVTHLGTTTAVTSIGTTAAVTSIGTTTAVVTSVGAAAKAVGDAAAAEAAAIAAAAKATAAVAQAGAVATGAAAETAAKITSGAIELSGKAVEKTIVTATKTSKKIGKEAGSAVKTAGKSASKKLNRHLSSTRDASKP